MKAYDEIYHTGKLGMKWGNRSIKKETSRTINKIKKVVNKDLTAEQLRSRNKKILITGASVAATILASYGAYKIYDKKVPRNIEATKHVTELIGRMPRGSHNGFVQYQPVYNTRSVTETVTNRARKYFK